MSKQKMERLADEHYSSMMYLEVKDTNGDRAVFTPNNSNGTIRIKKNGTNTDITTLKLVQGRVTKQMNKGIIESSKHNFDMFKGGYGSPSYNTNLNTLKI
jgi:hypothetical protein